MPSDYELLVEAGHDPEVAKRWADDMKRERQRQAREQSEQHDATIYRSMERGRGRVKKGRKSSVGFLLLLIVGLLTVYCGYLIFSVRG